MPTVYYYVVFGDQATCKTIRGAKRWSRTEIREARTLKWANEVPGACIVLCALLIILSSLIFNYRGFSLLMGVP